WSCHCPHRRAPATARRYNGPLRVDEDSDWTQQVLPQRGAPHSSSWWRPGPVPAPLRLFFRKQVELLSAFVYNALNIKSKKILHEYMGGCAALDRFEPDVQQG